MADKFLPVQANDQVSKGSTCLRLVDQNDGSYVQAVYVMNSGGGGLTGFTDSVANLAASGTYTGAARSVSSIPGMGFFNAVAYSDVAGTLYIDQSLDSGNTFQPVANSAIAAGSSAVLSVPVTGAPSTTQYRVRVVNGASPQTVFRLSSSFSAS